MKLYLVSGVFLLVALGFAHLAPSDHKVTSKIIYDQKYIITESYEPRWLHYEFYFGGGKFRQLTHNPKRLIDDMKIKADSKTGYQMSDVSVVIETFDYKRGHQMNCLQDSRSELVRLIEHCQGNVILRNLTSEEKEQMQKFKDEHQVTKSPFKMVYNKGHMRTQSIGSSEFDVTIKPDLEGFLFRLSSSTPDGGKFYHVTQREMEILDRKLPESSFTIEALPPGTKDVDCFGKHSHLEPYSCKGEVTIY